MNQRSFFFQLGSLSVGVAAILFLLHLIPLFQTDQTLSWASWLFFILFTIIVYFVAFRAALSENLHTFSSVIVGVVIGKMILSVLVVLVYVKLSQPESRFFLIPFFVVYFAFTIFEVYFMSKLGKMKSL